MKGTATLTVEEIPLFVTVTPTEATLNAVGQSVTLIPAATDSEGTPLTNVTYAWSSSDEGVAAVSQTGVVTAVANGQTTITVTGSLASAVGPQRVMGTGPTATALITVAISEIDTYFPLNEGRSWTYRHINFFSEGSPVGGSSHGPKRVEQVVQDQITGMVPHGGFNWYRACGGGIYAAVFWGFGCDLWRTTSEAVYLAGEEGAQPVVPMLFTPLAAGTSWTVNVGENAIDFEIVAVHPTLIVEGVTYTNVVQVTVFEMDNTKGDVFVAPGVGMIRFDFSVRDTGGPWQLWQQWTLMSSDPGTVGGSGLEGASGGGQGTQGSQKAVTPDGILHWLRGGG